MEPADDVLGAITEQVLRAFVEEDDRALLVGGDDGVGRALDQPGEIALGLLDLGVGGQSQLLSLLVLGDVRPGAHQLERTSGVVIDDLEGVLDPDVMPVAMAKAILDAAAAPADQRQHLAEGSRRVLGMEMIGPALRIGGHLLRRVAHDRAEIFAHEGAGIIAGRLGGVDDGGTYGEKVLEALARALQLCGDGLAFRLESFEITDPLPQAGKLVDELLLGLLVVVGDSIGCGRRGVCRFFLGFT